MKLIGLFAITATALTLSGCAATAGAINGAKQDAATARGLLDGFKGALKPEPALESANPLGAPKIYTPAPQVEK
jgi:hypothetical protein